MCPFNSFAAGKELLCRAIFNLHLLFVRIYQILLCFLKFTKWHSEKRRKLKLERENKKFNHLWSRV